MVLAAVAGRTQVVGGDDSALFCGVVSPPPRPSPTTHLSWVPCMLNTYVFVSLRSTETSLEELRASFLTTPKRSTLASWVVVSLPRSRVKNQRTS